MEVSGLVGFSIVIFIIIILVLVIWYLVKRSLKVKGPRQVIYYGPDGVELRRYERKEKGVHFYERSKLPINNYQTHSTNDILVVGGIAQVVSSTPETGSHTHQSCSSDSSHESSSSCSGSSYTNND